MTRLSIIIPTYRRTQSVFRLLESLSSQGLAKDQFEILIVSNFADEKLSWLVKKVNETQKNIRLLVAGVKGANASRNLGIKESLGELLLLLDDDCIVDNNNYLQTVIDLHQEYPDTLAIGGSYSIPGGCRLEDIAYNLISREWQLSNNREGGNSIRLLGGNVSYKAALLKSAGELFDPRISYGGAELEFHSRLSRAGALLLLIPDLTVHHVPDIRRGSKLVEKAYKQAMTTVLFSIHEGRAGNPACGYQPLRDMWALKHARDKWELSAICDLMTKYDRAYNMVAKDRITSLPRLKIKLLTRGMAEAIGWPE